jgi:plastocyanin
MTRQTRRRVLIGIAGTATLSFLAGCSGDGDGDGDDGDDTTDGEDTSDGDDTSDGEDGSDGMDDGEDGTDGDTTPTETVKVGPNTENVFDPDSLEISTGTEVTFVWESGGHSLIVDSQPDGANWSGVGETQDSGYEHTHTFDVAGTYEYYCEPHQMFGMEGTITVTE